MCTVVTADSCTQMFKECQVLLYMRCSVLTECIDIILYMYLLVCILQERESQMDGLELPEHDILGGGDDFKR
jgi:hypothetical protein